MLRRFAVIIAVLVILWQLVVWLTQAPAFILPPPYDVGQALVRHFDEIMFHAGVTMVEIVLGLLLGCTIGALSAWAILRFRPVRSWFLPVLVASQALPVFAIAPVLMLWLGFGMGSKIAMATLIIYFPVTAALYDGLRNTDSGWINLARIMGASNHTVLKYIRLPAALPS
ncbi:MAG: ABC transporter permease subunit, partial [Gammaproteobacteria bacterium]|nr:ABC transporter permease subunit [Gammaproteobacteria bacterium]